VASWVTAVLIIFFTLNGPLHEWADEFLFSAHMVQHLLHMLVMPPFLIWGLPPWLIRRALVYPWIRGAGRLLTHPAVAFVAYNVVFIFWHLPQNYDWALMDHEVHIGQHLSFMAVAVMMWWPVVNPVEELERIPTGPLLMGYIFLFGIPGTVISALITLADSPIYRWYAAAPRITGLSALDDQRLGGLIMWIPGMLIFWIAITAVFFRWTQDEYRSWREDPEAPSPL
jgi:putative membrane protein